MLEIIYSNDKVIRYRSPIEWKNENAYLVLSYDCDTEETLKDGKYVEFLRVIDPRGDKYYTERVAFEIKNGKVKNMTIKE